MPTRCNRWFLYCRSYCLLNMFRTPLCPSSGAQEYYTGGCCLWHLVLWFSICRSGAKLWVVCPVCGMLRDTLKLLMMGIMVPETCWANNNTQPTPLHQTDNLKTTAPNTTDSNHLYNTLELLMMGIIVPETCWASNKIFNKETTCCI